MPYQLAEIFVILRKNYRHFITRVTNHKLNQKLLLHIPRQAHYNAERRYGGGLAP